MLVEITERAMAHCGSQEVLIVGGVGCKYIRHRCLKEKKMESEIFEPCLKISVMSFVPLGRIVWCSFHHPVPKCQDISSSSDITMSL